MKKAELATIVLIASISVLVAYLVTQSLLGGITNESVKIKTIDRIESAFEPPSKDVFNEDAINPTVEVQINNGS
jgi:hypothetical protein